MATPHVGTILLAAWLLVVARPSDTTPTVDSRSLPQDRPQERRCVGCPSQRIVIRAARVYDPGSAVEQRDVVVIIENGRITDVRAATAHAAAMGDSIIDLPDATLLPGLIDAHVHLSTGASISANARATLRGGFTTVVDAGATSFDVIAFRDSVSLGHAEGPRILAAGMWIGVKGGVCEFTGIGVAGNPEAFRERVRQNVAAGADLIKVCVTGWAPAAFADPDAAELPEPLLAAAVTAAHRDRRRVVAHAISREGVRRAVAAGVNGLVHAAYLDGSLVSRMRERGTWLVPTLASLIAGDTTPRSRALQASVRLAHTQGVSLVFGTDGGVLPHGRNAVEAVAMSRAGLAARDILAAATTNAAHALGLADSVGSVRAGMVADLVAVAGDPLSDLTALQRPVFVMARGRVVVRPADRAR